MFYNSRSAIEIHKAFVICIHLLLVERLNIHIVYVHIFLNIWNDGFQSFYVVFELPNPLIYIILYKILFLYVFQNVFAVYFKTPGTSTLMKVCMVNASCP